MTEASVIALKRRLNSFMSSYGTLLAKLDDDRGVTDRDFASVAGLGTNAAILDPRVVTFTGSAKHGVSFVDNNGVHQTLWKGCDPITVDGTNPQMAWLEDQGYITISLPEEEE